MTHARNLVPLMMVLSSCSPAHDDQSPSNEMSAIETNSSYVPETFKIARPMTDEDVAWVVTELMGKHVDIDQDEADYRRSLKPATAGQLAVYAGAAYLTEVNNGGHQQFFSNSTGIVWRDALDGLNKIGALKHRQILEEAVAVFPEGLPARDRESRNAQLDELDISLFDVLDDRLYRLDESFEALAASYIRIHPEEFFTNP